MQQPTSIKTYAFNKRRTLILSNEFCFNEEMKERKKGQDIIKEI